MDHHTRIARLSRIVAGVSPQVASINRVLRAMGETPVNVVHDVRFRPSDTEIAQAQRAFDDYWRPMPPSPHDQLQHAMEGE